MRWGEVRWGENIYYECNATKDSIISILWKLIDDLAQRSKKQINNSHVFSEE